MSEKVPDMWVLLTMEDVRIIMASLLDRESVIKGFMQSDGADQEICKDAINKIRKLLDHFMTNYQTIKNVFGED